MIYLDIYILKHLLQSFNKIVTSFTTPASLCKQPFCNCNIADADGLILTALKLSTLLDYLISQIPQQKSSLRVVQLFFNTEILCF